MANKQFNSVDGYSVGNASIVIDANGNISGNLIVATANVTAPRFISNVATGAAPFVVTSTTQVANLNVATAGTVTTNAQPNITSVGTLTSLAVTGNVTVGNIIGNFANGTSDISIPASGGNINFDIGGVANVFVVGTNGSITSANLADAVGYKGIPQNSQSAQYTLALSDMGKHIDISTGGIVIPANGSVAFPIGATIVIFNDSASTQTISITTDTLRQAGTTNTGTRTLAAYGIATLLKVAATVWVVSGNVT